MRYVILLLIVAAAVADITNENWMEEEELKEPLDEYVNERERRDVDDLRQFEENLRVKRSEEQIYRDGKKRSELAPQQVQKYEVHKQNQESAVPSPSYEEFSAAGAVHYHMYQAPEADLLAAADYLHKKHQRGHEQGEGRYYHSAHHSKHGNKGDNGYRMDHYVDKGKKGFKTDYKHRNEYEEAAGKKKKHHDRANHRASSEEEAQGIRGANFAEKKDHKKRHKTKGYHNKYHTDESHKEHDFYDDFHDSGEHHRYGKFNARHASHERGKKKVQRVDAGHDLIEQGKKGYSNKSHMGSEHKGLKGKLGYEEYHEKHFQSGKKNGKGGGSHWGYSKN